MPVLRPSPRLVEVAQRWRALAERRLADLADLHCSGRWKQYYAEARLLAELQDAAHGVEVWSAVIAEIADGEIPGSLPKTAA